MEGKIIEGKDLKTYKKKYGRNKSIKVISIEQVKQDSSKLDNKEWWLTDIFSILKKTAYKTC